MRIAHRSLASVSPWTAALVLALAPVPAHADSYLLDGDSSVQALVGPVQPLAGSFGLEAVSACCAEPRLWNLSWLELDGGPISFAGSPLGALPGVPEALADLLLEAGDVALGDVVLQRELLNSAQPEPGVALEIWRDLTLLDTGLAHELSFGAPDAAFPTSVRLSWDLALVDWAITRDADPDDGKEVPPLAEQLDSILLARLNVSAAWVAVPEPGSLALMVLAAAAAALRRG